MILQRKDSSIVQTMFVNVFPIIMSQLHRNVSLVIGHVLHAPMPVNVIHAPILMSKTLSLENASVHQMQSSLSA